MSTLSVVEVIAHRIFKANIKVLIILVNNFHTDQ